MKIFRVFLQALLLLVLLLPVGCVKSKDPIRVAVFTSDPAIIKILNDALAGIEKRNPGLKVMLNSIPYGNYQDKITTQIVAGNAPDVVSVEVNNFVDLYLRGAFEDLTDLAKRDGVQTSDFYPAVMERFTPGGRIFAIPSDIAPSGLLYYNKKVFDEAGVPYPTSKMQWPEPFMTLCRKLVKKDAAGKTLRWAFADAYTTNADAFLLSNDGYYTDREYEPTRLALDTTQALEAYNFRFNMIYKHGVSPTPEQLQSYSFGQGAENMFMNGQIAMMVSGVWHTPKFLADKNLSFDVVDFPAGPRGTKGWGCGGSGYAMSKGCKNKDLAWIVIQELTGVTLVTELVKTGLLQPARVKLAESDVFLNAPGAPNKRILLTMPKYARFGPFMKNWPEIWNGQVGPALDSVWLANKKPVEVLPDITARVNRKYFPKN